MNCPAARITGRFLRSRAGLIGSSLTLASMLLAAPADAAEPVDQACLGESFSALAAPGFGHGVVFFAQNGGPADTRTGLGDGIQLLQSGVVPDAIVPNTCNNP